MTRAAEDAVSVSTAGLHVVGLGVQRSGRPVLDAVTFVAPAGAITALIGPNGAGKSSLLLACLGLITARGSVRWRGEELIGLAPEQRARRIGYVPQRSQLASGQSVREVVAAARFAWHGALGRCESADAAAVAAALAACQLSGLASRRFAELSAGEQARVLLARALAGTEHADRARAAGTASAEANAARSSVPRLLLLDEPGASLDPGQVLAVEALLRGRAARGDGVLIALHDLACVRRLADRVVLLDRGGVAAVGTQQEVLGSAAFLAAYGVRLIPGGGDGMALCGAAPAQNAVFAEQELR